jgi:hypothetical protein
VRFQDSDTGNIRIGATDVTLDNITFAQGTASVTFDARANGGAIEINNQGSIAAILSACHVIGRKITDYGRMEAEARDGLSVARYGRLSLNLNLQSVDNFEYAERIAQYEANRRGDPRGRVGKVSLLSHVANGGGNHAHQLTRTIGDAITIVESQTGHGIDGEDRDGKRYIIIGEAHRLSGSEFNTTWYLEPVAEPPYFAKVGVTGRDELDQNAYLGF